MTSILEHLTYLKSKLILSNQGIWEQRDGSKRLCSLSPVSWPWIRVPGWLGATQCLCLLLYLLPSFPAMSFPSTCCRYGFCSTERKAVSLSHCIICHQLGEVINLKIFTSSRYGFGLLCINKVSDSFTYPTSILFSLSFGSLKASQSVPALSSSFLFLNSFQSSGDSGTFWITTSRCFSAVMAEVVFGFSGDSAGHVSLWNFPLHQQEEFNPCGCWDFLARLPFRVLL